MINWLERLSFVVLAGAVLMFLFTAFLDEFLRRTEGALNGLVPVADRLGDVGAAWWRLVTAVRRACAQWRQGNQDDLLLAPSPGVPTEGKKSSEKGQGRRPSAANGP